jgi:hypothetical protein
MLIDLPCDLIYRAFLRSPEMHGKSRFYCTWYGNLTYHHHLLYLYIINQQLLQIITAKDQVTTAHGEAVIISLLFSNNLARFQYITDCNLTHVYISILLIDNES